MPRRSVASGAKWSRANLLFRGYTQRTPDGPDVAHRRKLREPRTIFLQKLQRPRRSTPATPQRRDIAHFIKHYDNVCRGTPRIISERRIPAKIARQSLRQCSAAMRDLHEEGRGGDDFLLKMHDTREERRRGEDRGGLTRHSFIIAAFNITRERGGAV